MRWRVFHGEHSFDDHKRSSRYRLVGEVEAENLDQVFAITSEGGEHWPKSQVVSLLLANPRSIRPGDVVVDEEDHMWCLWESEWREMGLGLHSSINEGSFSKRQQRSWTSKKDRSKYSPR